MGGLHCSENFCIDSCDAPLVLAPSTPVTDLDCGSYLLPGCSGHMEPDLDSLVGHICWFGRPRSTFSLLHGGVLLFCLESMVLTESASSPGLQLCFPMREVRLCRLLLSLGGADLLPEYSVTVDKEVPALRQSGGLALGTLNPRTRYLIPRFINRHLLAPLDFSQNSAVGQILAIKHGHLRLPSPSFCKLQGCCAGPWAGSSGQCYSEEDRQWGAKHLPASQEATCWPSGCFPQ